MAKRDLLSIDDLTRAEAELVLDTAESFLPVLQRDIKKVPTLRGRTIIFGGDALKGEEFASGCYVEPTLAEVESQFPVVKEETFAPVLYLIEYETIDEAIRHLAPALRPRAPGGHPSSRA